MRDLFDLCTKAGWKNVVKHKFNSLCRKNIVKDTWAGLNCLVRGHKKIATSDLCIRCWSKVK